ncbi:MULTISPECIES: PKD domain-containing protein [Chryseobacterium]|uniref:Membrane protein n=1 Tax=Chryseobacterium camelliae TaxID=1265445 RepID=A0ABU0TLY6_9FLAO|nr:MULTISPECIES: PKD domain-containing protein [Chryseobacterium]MDT3408910.1 putative membrane protein [Pseudacidovorax intermedius]MDQ1097233.1 putative membrane protein [Chryseobacterium camelliae]MDQ1101168.1 putative membrane protein [Chryseobacterium sp. SORGH_AS_1048]MDR6084613.1 putative membrane protein [Chryseobacterium sp. SORGH_AS_0909]MDR6132885.1 putative membrane protein [Chryseobacterium sp. SORGH_AS_1175]
MNYFQKNKKNIIIGVIAVLLIAALVALWLQKKVIHSADDIVGVVYPSSVKVGDTLMFEDKTQFAKTKRWNFGDGTTSDKSSGIHFYSKPGYYQVTLIIDNEYTKSFPVMVSARSIPKPKDTIVAPTTIDAPSQAMQYENVQFRAISEAKQFTWKFGETGKIDSKDKLAIYSYKKPGDYVVTLYTDENIEPILHHIKIIAGYDSMDEEVSVEDAYAKIDNDFKYHLQQIANGNSFNMHYNYLLRTYLCNNENTVVKVNDSKVNNFYMYCAGLQFDKNNVIQTVKVNFDDAQNCVTKVDINQSK